jgi:hypothetical protein
MRRGNGGSAGRDDGGSVLLSSKASFSYNSNFIMINDSARHNILLDTNETLSYDIHIYTHPSITPSTTTSTHLHDERELELTPLPDINNKNQKHMFLYILILHTYIHTRGQRKEKYWIHFTIT